jgi:two-component system cell cycle sensor histidine kinase/response regulator CckA
MAKKPTYEELEQRVKELEKEVAHHRDAVVRLRESEEKKRKLEAQLQQGRKMEAIGTLAGGIAHDFNNLLMAILGNASLMLYDIDSTHPHYELLRGITTQVRSGAELTAHLLGYARKGRYEVKPINLNQLVEETSYTFGRINRVITIYKELADDLLGIEADQRQIDQVLLNLYINAAEAMPGGGTLTLKSMNVTHKNMKDRMYDPKPGSYVLLTVTDTGTGMDKETQERIFEPFFTTKEMGKRTGLGLASVYGIIKGHRGYIHVDSEKGRGTTFSIYLPASEKKPRKVVKTNERVIEGTGMVLLVDDEEIILKVGKDLLEALGYRVLTAKDGQEAIEVYKKNRDGIDIVLLDMVMPNVGGSDVYDRMKEINPDVKVLLSSGYSIDGQAAEILERGCNGFLQKPFNMQELSRKIREIVEEQ